MWHAYVRLSRRRFQEIQTQAAGLSTLHIHLLALEICIFLRLVCPRNSLLCLN